jgi:hypothetical protein
LVTRRCLRGFVRQGRGFTTFLLVVVATSCGVKSSRETSAGPAVPEFARGISYTNHRVAGVPWSINIVRVDRSRPELELHSTHARGTVMGLGTLSEQIRSIKPEIGVPLAGVNGDFYQRDRVYAGDPRGLQIVEGDLISSPTGGVSLWVDANGQPHVANVVSRLKITWPGGETTPIGLNENRPPRAAVLYTPSLGPSTGTTRGRELVLEKQDGGPWLPLHVGETYKARVREVRENGDTRLQPEILVLSLGPILATNVPVVKGGHLLTISTETTPDLRGATTAISGGPILAHDGQRRSPPSVPAGGASYEFATMWERHPRTAIGWNEKYFFFVEVDGRQRDLSVGMKLEELGDYMVKTLGCTEAMNLDGGGSAMLWANGHIANSPCDGGERSIANALIVVRKEKTGSKSSASLSSRAAGQNSGKSAVP